MRMVPRSLVIYSPLQHLSGACGVESSFLALWSEREENVRLEGVESAIAGSGGVLDGSAAGTAHRRGESQSLPQENVVSVPAAAAVG